MTHFAIIQSANAIAGLGLILFFNYRLKSFLKGYLRAASR